MLHNFTSQGNCIGPPLLFVPGTEMKMLYKNGSRTILKELNWQYHSNLTVHLFSTIWKLRSPIIPSSIYFANTFYCLMFIFVFQRKNSLIWLRLWIWALEIPRPATDFWMIMYKSQPLSRDSLLFSQPLSCLIRPTVLKGHLLHVCTASNELETLCWLGHIGIVFYTNKVNK